MTPPADRPTPRGDFYTPERIEARGPVVRALRAESSVYYAERLINAWVNYDNLLYDAGRTAAHAETVRAETLAEVRRIVEVEEEASGPMPDAMWRLFRSATIGANRDNATQIIRGTIAATKKSILVALTEYDRTHSQETPHDASDSR